MKKNGIDPNEPGMSVKHETEKLKKQDNFSEKKAESQFLQQLILSSIDEMIVFHDIKMRIRWANRAACIFYQMPLENMIGKTCHALLNRPIDACRGCPVKKVLKTKEFYQDILTFPEGKTFLINAYPIFEGAKLSGVVEVSLDITERTKIEKELKKAKDESMAASEAKSRFLANVSHDIRTQMNVILGMTNLIYESTPSDEQNEYLVMIRESSFFLLTLVNDLLDISKIEAGKLELVLEPFNLYREIGKTITLFTLQAQKKNLRLFCSIDDNVPGYVIGDQARLHQILINLIGNGIKYTSSGEVAINLKLLKTGKSDTDSEVGQDKYNTVMIEFSVKDTGIGIPADKLDTVFIDYAQTGSYSAISKQEGSGLGLSISKSLVELMGGSIRVESIEGKGSTFYFTIPFALPEVVNEKMEQTAPINMEAIPGNEFGNYAGRRLDILLVDDKPVNKKFISILLEKKGHRVLAVKNVKEVLMALKARKFDLILMDVHMPGMDSLEATNLIREEEQKTGGHIPIVAMTNYAMKKEHEKCLQADMDYFISKPVAAEDLNKILDQVIGNSNFKN